MRTRTVLFFRNDQCPPQYFSNCGGAIWHPIFKSKFVNSGEFVR
jgi:hypothetical protein